MPEERTLATGVEAVAWAAAAAGVAYVAHYPGSPVSGVAPALRVIAEAHGLPVVFHDGLNEHVAALAAGGAALCGARALLVMKHVGLNVAADPLSYLGYSGVKGGLVVVVGTDPGANQSTGEEDVHWYARLFNLPLLEPTSAAQVLRVVGDAFALSERHGLPALVFLPVRLCTASAYLAVPALPVPARRYRFEKDPERMVNVGQRAVRNHRRLLERLEAVSAEPGGASTWFEPTARAGLVTRGTTFGQVYEAVERLGLARRVALLNVERVHPLPRGEVLEFLRGKDDVLVVEDQDGFLEAELKAQLFGEVGCSIQGKAEFPAWGEVTLGAVVRALARRFGVVLLEPPRLAADVEVPERLGAFCEGCPHRGAFYALERALEGRDAIVGGDIGCSSLPPFRADWLLCMNAGIGLAQGMAQLGTDQVVVSTGGDGSFFHTGLIALQNAVRNRIDLIHVVLDNRAVAMTGHQPSPTTPRPGSRALDVRALLGAIGVDRVIEVSASRPTAFAARLRRELGRKGVRVFWVHGECAQRPDPLRELVRRTRVLSIAAERCGECTECHDRLGCPAIQPAVAGAGAARHEVRSDRCARCGTCLDVCGRGAMRSAFSCSGAAVMRHAAAFVRARVGSA